jgi:hypothetical protein
MQRVGVGPLPVRPRASLGGGGIARQAGRCCVLAFHSYPIDAPSVIRLRTPTLALSARLFQTTGRSRSSCLRLLN